MNQRNKGACLQQIRHWVTTMPHNVDCVDVEWIVGPVSYLGPYHVEWDNIDI